MKINISPAARATIKTFATAILSAVAALVGESIQKGNLTLDWTAIWHTAVAAAVGYVWQKLGFPAPTTIHIDPSKTTVIDKCTKQTLVNANKPFKL